MNRGQHDTAVSLDALSAVAIDGLRVSQRQPGRRDNKPYDAAGQEGGTARSGVKGAILDVSFSTDAPVAAHVSTAGTNWIHSAISQTRQR